MVGSMGWVALGAVQRRSDDGSVRRAGWISLFKDDRGVGASLGPSQSYIESGASTPIKSRAVATTWRVASHSASRLSRSSGSAGSTGHSV
jgi:hypothetical protein